MNKHGQSMIEYALIAVLVILGVVIMGPYALRSVGAHFKLWDDAVQDSMTENLTQAPIGDVPVINVTCTYTNTPVGCGSDIAGSQCAANQMIYSHNTNPQLCDGAAASYCVDDPSCCSAQSAEACGSIPIGQTAPADNCNYGYRLYGYQCGANSLITCKPDSGCNPQCLGVQAPGVIACPGWSFASLNANYGINYVSEQSNCTGAPCQYYCNNSLGYFINSSGTACTNVFNVAYGVNDCNQGDNAGFVCNSSLNTTPYTQFSCSSNGPYITVNNCSFTICAASPTTPISIKTIVDISQPQTPPGCSQPQGNPGEKCEIEMNY